MKPDMQAFNHALIEEFGTHDGKLSGQLANSTVLLLTTTGAKSGAKRVTPLGFVKDGERFIVIAANAGAPDHPDWYYNFLAHPEVMVEVGSERFSAHARIAPEGDTHHSHHRVSATGSLGNWEIVQVAHHRSSHIVVIPLPKPNKKRSGSSQRICPRANEVVSSRV